MVGSSDSHGVTDEGRALDATRGPFQGQLAVDYSGQELPEEGQSAAQAPVIAVDFRVVGALVRHRVNVSDRHMRPRWKVWLQNRLHRHGFSPEEKRQKTTERGTRRPTHRQDYHPNIARPIVTQHLNIVADSRYHAAFRASQAEFEDEMRAEKARALWNYQASVDDTDRIRREALEYAADCGALAFCKIRVDPHDGDIVDQFDDGNGPMPVFNGLIRQELIPTWEMGWEPDCFFSGDDGLENCEWLFHRTRVSTTQLQGLLNEEQLAKVTMTGQDQFDDEAQMTGLEELSNPNGDGGMWSGDRHGSRQRNHVYVEYYQRRSREWRWGLHVKMVDGQVVHVGVAPFAHFDEKGYFDLPFVAYNHDPVAGRMVGVSPMDKVREIQMAVNASESSRLEAELAAAYRKIFITGVSELKGGWRTEHAQIWALPANASVKTVDMKPPGIEEHVTTQLGKGFGADLIGVHDQTMGRVDITKSATEAGNLQNSDHIANMAHVLRLNRFTQACARRVLWLASKVYSMPRRMHISGDDGVMRDIFFAGADIEGYTDIEIGSDAFLPAGRGDRILALRDVIQDTAALSPDGRPAINSQQYLDAIDFKADQLGDVERNRRNAREEAAQILEQGAEPPIYRYQDHATRVEVWTQIVESSMFRRATPALQAHFEGQIDLRKQFMHALAQEEALAAAMITDTMTPPDEQAGPPQPPAQ